MPISAAFFDGLQDQFVDTAHDGRGQGGGQGSLAGLAQPRHLDLHGQKQREALANAPPHGKPHGSQLHQLDVQRAHQRGLGLQGLQVQIGHALELHLPVAHRVVIAHDEAQHVLAQAFTQRQQAGVLVFELLVEGATRYVGPRHDVGDRELGVTFFRQGLGEGVQQPRAVI